MAAIVCHGLQLSLESQLVESRILSFRLPSPKPVTPTQPVDLSFKSCFLEPNTNTKNHCENNNTISSNSNQGGWSSIQVFSNVSQSQTTTYVPPHVKLSWMQLSPKSLELCTENLGNETGTDMKESNIDLFSSTNSVGGNLESKNERKSSQVLEAKKAKTKNFPPPLTTMRGSESLRVRPHREGGRLVIEVTKVPSSASCFQAERSHGRLRLCFWTDPEEEEEDYDDIEKEQEEEEEEEEVVEEEFDESENEGGDGMTRVGGYKENSIWNIGSDVRKEKYERRRCKEGEHENNESLLLVNKSWGEPLWIATS